MMTNRIVFASSLLFLMIVGIAGFLASRDTTIVHAGNTEAAPAAPTPPLAGACDSQVAITQITPLSAGDFEVKWNFNPPDSCFSPSTFLVTITLKRQPGFSRTKSVTVPGNSRSAVVKFGDPLLRNNVEVTAVVKGSIKLDTQTTKTQTL